MKIAFMILCAVFYNCVFAQHVDNFEAYARTKDSLMHIAFYDRDIAEYKKQFDDFMITYNKLEPKTRRDYDWQVQEEYYYLARAYALKGDKANAIDNLERSEYYNYKELASEKDFDGLRAEPGFVQFVEKAKRKKNKYQLLLQQESYIPSGQAGLPAFKYQPASDTNLRKLSKTFKLDSVAGAGNDVSKIINLMKWVHYLVPHNRSVGNPETMNALSLIQECKKDGKTLNCRGLAIMLNEVYLANGFKSRYVTCLPKDTTDEDCHVITMVWSSSLKKWLWMDPTFMAYVMNEEGTPLSIEEVRQRMIDSRPLLLNPDANHNNATTQTKEHYLDYYMAKNLYRLQCPVESKYDYETDGWNKKVSYIQLTPIHDLPQISTARNRKGREVYRQYYTNDPSIFWAAPPGANSHAKDGGGHTQQQYEDAMRSFKNCYNRQSADCVASVLIPESKRWINSEKLSEWMEEYGKLNQVKYLGIEIDNPYQDVALFKMVYDRSVHCMAISLDENNRIATFRFKTYSNYIDWILAKDIQKSGQ